MLLTQSEIIGATFGEKSAGFVNHTRHAVGTRGISSYRIRFRCSFAANSGEVRFGAWAEAALLFTLTLRSGGVRFGLVRLCRHFGRLRQLRRDSVQENANRGALFCREGEFDMDNIVHMTHNARRN